MNPSLLAAVTALNAGHKDQAADILITHLSSDGESPPRTNYTVLLGLLAELQRIDDGLVWSERAVGAFPRDHEIHLLRGNVLRSAGRQIDAIRAFDAAIALNPADPNAIFSKGQCYSELGRGEDAEAVFKKLARQHPRNPGVLRALARAQSLQGKFKSAQSQLQTLLTIDRRNVDTWLDLSALAADQYRFDEALAIIDRALEALPAQPELIRAKIVLLRVAGKTDASLAFISGLLRQYGESAQLLHELALVRMNTDLDGAIELLRRAAGLDPTNTEYSLALAECMARQQTAQPGQNIDNAHAVLAGVPPRMPLQAYEAKVRADVLSQAADFGAIATLGDFAELAKLWGKAGQTGALMPHLARVETLADRHVLIDQHRVVGQHFLTKAQHNPIARGRKPRTDSRIRIGFMSSDLRAHPVAYFAWPLFRHADRDRFEIYCYSWYDGREADETQRRIASMVDGFRWQPVIEARQAAQLIADDDLDLLIEMGGYTHMNKLDVMAWKPARLTASWLGYPHSAGLSTIDYLLVDPFLSPPDSRLLIEKPLTMPRSWITMSEQAFPSDLPIEPKAPVNRNGVVTFGTANNPYKYNRAMVRCWAQIMAQVPGSRFLFVRPEAGSRIFRENINAIFAAEGIATDRIEFRAVRGDHMRHYNDIDITLDTFPQTGGTTTCEAIWMGVPTVTMVGEALFERLSYSILTNAGLGDLCATTVEDYVAIAVDLAGDVDRIQALRTGLRDQIRTGPLGDASGFAKDFYDLVAATVDAHRPRAANG